MENNERNVNDTIDEALSIIDRPFNGINLSDEHRKELDMCVEDSRKILIGTYTFNNVYTSSESSWLRSGK